MVQKKKYFMTNSLGAMPMTVGPALQAMMETWVEKGADAWEDWVPRSQRVSDQVARIIGAPSGSVALHLNVSSLLAQLLSSFDFFSGKRNKIVLSDRKSVV
jgi:kynureninase